MKPAAEHTGRSNDKAGPISIWLPCVLAGFFFLAGAIFFLKGSALPVYTDAAAPGRLSLELADKPREVRFGEWYRSLATFETAHKKWTDLGRGLMAFGVGVVIAGWLFRFCLHNQGRRWVVGFVIAWLGLWAVRVPLTYRYYMIRQSRFDYPSWGDSIAIPMISEGVAWVFGAFVSMIVLRILMIRHEWEASLRYHRPQGIAGWFRGGFLVLWLILLVLCVVSGIPDGDEGMVIACMGAVPLLLAVLFARPKAAAHDDPEADPKPSDS